MLEPTKGPNFLLNQTIPRARIRKRIFTRVRASLAVCHRPVRIAKSQDLQCVVLNAFGIVAVFVCDYGHGVGEPDPRFIGQFLVAVEVVRNLTPGIVVSFAQRLKRPTGPLSACPRHKCPAIQCLGPDFFHRRREP